MHISMLHSVSPQQICICATFAPPPPALLDAYAVASVVNVDKFVDQRTDGNTMEYVQTLPPPTFFVLALEHPWCDDMMQISTSKNKPCLDGT